MCLCFDFSRSSGSITAFQVVFYGGDAISCLRPYPDFDCLFVANLDTFAATWLFEYIIIELLHECIRYFLSVFEANISCEKKSESFMWTLLCSSCYIMNKRFINRPQEVYLFFLFLSGSKSTSLNFTKTQI